MESAEHPTLTGLSPEQVGLAMAADGAISMARSSARC